MNQQERYELLTKLSEFYVKEVKYNLEYFNKAKFISKASHIVFWLLALSMVSFIPMVLIVGFLASIIKVKVFELYFLFLFKAKYVRVSFKDKKIVILIHTGRDMFNLANFLSDIGEKTFVQCFEEICSVLDLVEELKLNEKLGL